MYTNKLVITILLGIIFGFSNLSFCHAELPDLGNLNRSYLSKQKESILGQSWYYQMRGAEIVDPDPIVTEYLKYLTNRISAQAHLRDHAFTPFLIRNNQVNAFAFFGGHIGVHYGLINLTVTESELAAVLAHETAHITQEHLLAQIGYSRRALPITIAEALAAIALGMPDLMMAAMAGHIQDSLKFSRTHEKEADRIGLKMLNQAGFNPQGMPDIFRRMQQDAKHFSKPPEYLLTHPHDESRLADTSNRVHQLPYYQVADSLMFHLIKARVQVKMAEDIRQLIPQLEQQLKTKRYTNQTATHYAYALALHEINQSKRAIKLLEKLTQQNPDNLILQLSLNDIILARQQPDIAKPHIQMLHTLYPENLAVSLQYVDYLIQTQQIQHAYKQLQSYKQQFPESPKVFRYLMQIEQKLNHPVAMYEASAEWHRLNGDMPSALQQLEFAIEKCTDNDIAKSRIKTRQKALMELFAIQKSGV